MRSARSGSSLIAKIPRFGARHEAVVDGELVGEVAALGDLDRVDLADEVGDRRVGRRELLAEAAVAVHPVDRRVVAVLGDRGARACDDTGIERIVVDLAARDDRHPLVEQADERAHDARLRLAALAEEHDVVAGEQRVGELRDDGVVVADHAVDERLALGEGARRVGADLVLDRSRHPTAGAQLSERGRTGHGAPCVRTGPAFPWAPGRTAASVGRAVPGRYAARRGRWRYKPAVGKGLRRPGSSGFAIPRST